VKTRLALLFCAPATARCRPVMDGGVVRWSATDDSRHHARARDARSSSPGLLAFIPFAVAQNAVSRSYYPRLH